MPVVPRSREVDETVRTRATDPVFLRPGRDCQPRVSHRWGWKLPSGREMGRLGPDLLRLQQRGTGVYVAKRVEDRSSRVSARAPPIGSDTGISDSDTGKPKRWRVNACQAFCQDFLWQLFRREIPAFQRFSCWKSLAKIFCENFFEILPSIPLSPYAGAPKYKEYIIEESDTGADTGMRFYKNFLP